MCKPKERGCVKTNKHIRRLFYIKIWVVKRLQFKFDSCQNWTCSLFVLNFNGNLTRIMQFAVFLVGIKCVRLVNFRNQVTYLPITTIRVKYPSVPTEHFPLFRVFRKNSNEKNDVLPGREHGIILGFFMLINRVFVV